MLSRCVRLLHVFVVLALAGCAPEEAAPPIQSGSANLAGPAVHLRLQAGFPTLPANPDSSLDTALQLLNDPFARWAELVQQMSGGQVTYEIAACCGKAATGAVHEAVGKGEVLDGAQGIAAYLYNTSSALRRTAGLFDGGFSELDTEAMLDWMARGGGQQLYEELMRRLGYDVVIIPFGAIPSQNLGWFPIHLTDRDDLVTVPKLRYRTAGIANEMIAKLGMQPTAIGAGDLIAALQEGRVDAVEFNSPGNDLALGLHTAVRPGCQPAASCHYTYYLGGLGQVAEWFDIILNAEVYEALSPGQRQIMRTAARVAGLEFARRVAEVDAESLAILRQKVEVLPVPADIVQAQREKWVEVINCPNDKTDPDEQFFCQVVASIRAFAASRR